MDRSGGSDGCPDSDRQRSNGERSGVMTDYYSDHEKLSYPRAEQLVERYLAKIDGRRELITSRDPLRNSSYPITTHNQRRVHRALDDRCVRLGTDTGNRTRFIVSEEYNEDSQS